jgi:hypothetical protein
MPIPSRISAAVTVMMSALLPACSGPSQSERSSTELTPLFSDPSSSGLTLEVFEADGNLAVFVGGPIGTEIDARQNLGSNSSLAQLYRNLHPTASEIPTELLELDEIVAPLLASRAEFAATEAPPAATLQDVAENTVEKSESAFRSTVCKTFTEGNFRYTPVECHWKANINLVSASTGLTVKAFDRAYGWNNTIHEAKIAFFPCLEGCNGAFVDLPASWWKAGWMLSGGPYVAAIHPKTFVLNPGGDRGGTHHRETIIIR